MVTQSVRGYTDPEGVSNPGYVVYSIYMRISLETRLLFGGKGEKKRAWYILLRMRQLHTPDQLCG